MKRKTIGALILLSILAVTQLMRDDQTTEIPKAEKPFTDTADQMASPPPAPMKIKTKGVKPMAFTNVVAPEGGIRQFTEADFITGSGSGSSSSSGSGEVLRRPRPMPAQLNTEAYGEIEERGFIAPLQEGLSTFSIDVDTASYSNLRRFAEPTTFQGTLPPRDAVRIEEMINYFDYSYIKPSLEDTHPISINTAVATAPWNPAHQLVQIGLQGYEVPWEERPPSNLVFLVDVSGSMRHGAKLPLLKDSLSKLVKRLDKRDRVAIVVYAGASGLALPSTTADNQETIIHALTQLQSGGSTNGEQGLELAYATAERYLIEGGNNRIILCTDGDFNIGEIHSNELVDFVQSKSASNVFLTICGFGTGNYNDKLMETLSNKGNGNYAYIDNAREATRVFNRDIVGTLITLAKDVKVQVEFNPEKVAGYRLLGYENRMLNAEDFKNDKKDAGEMGSGHSVTALYEIVPVGAESEFTPKVPELKYQQVQLESSPELLTINVRYKLPTESTSQLLTATVEDKVSPMTADLAFASAVAEAGLLLRGSKFASASSWESLLHRASENLDMDSGGYRSEFLEIMTVFQQRTWAASPATPR